MQKAAKTLGIVDYSHILKYYALAVEISETHGGAYLRDIPASYGEGLRWWNFMENNNK